MKIDFSDRIRMLRESKGWTQAQLATKLHVSKMVISSYERGIYQPRLEMLVQIAQVFGVTLDFLVGRVDASDPSSGKHIDLSGLTESDIEELARLSWVFREKNEAMNSMGEKVTELSEPDEQ